jgi:uncharacterized protein YdbL (DUF1318 family)
MNGLRLGIFLIILSINQAFCLSLDQAKQSGVVGEAPSGYLEVVKPSPEAQKLVSEVNSKRKAAYEQIAQKNGSDLKVVEQFGAKEAIEQSAPGTLVKSQGGGWVRK